MIYLDHNATTPPRPEVLEAMERAARDAWGNPSSVHRVGQRARRELERARAAVAALVARGDKDVVLTSGGTEANNLALRSAFADARGGALVVSGVEHPSVLRCADLLSREGVVTRVVAPRSDGAVWATDFDSCFHELAEAGVRVRLVAVMAVNHETGVIQPVDEVAELAHRAGATVHVDAVQAVGKVPPELWSAADTLSLAAHKIGGPKGIGALIARPGLSVRPLLVGGAQERGVRPGTPDVTAAAGLAALAAPIGPTDLGRLRDRVEQSVVELAARAGIEALVNGTAPRVSHVTNISLGAWRGAELCAALDLEGVAISSGSACSAGTAEPSPVITAMVGRERALGAVRISLGERTTDDEITRALAAFQRVLQREKAC